MTPSSDGPVVWTIAGSDPSGGGGIQADLRTIQALDGFACAVITAITAQQPHAVDGYKAVSPEWLRAQLASLVESMPPRAIKLGMLPTVGSIQAVAELLEQVDCPVVADPVMASSGGTALMRPDAAARYLELLAPHLTLLTPNRREAERLNLNPMSKSNEVLFKGGHDDDTVWSIDRWQEQAFVSPRLRDANSRGTGCCLSSAIACGLARGLDLSDAIVVGKALLNQAMRCRMPLSHGAAMLRPHGWPDCAVDFPTLGISRELSFVEFVPPSLPLYPIVDSADWVECLLGLGVEVVQLRLKHRVDVNRDAEIARAVQAGEASGALVIINDDWKAALQHRARGVHLGQDDLEKADLHALAAGGVILGLSTHSYTEIARARAYNPSYIAIGTVHPTDSKEMDCAPLGLDHFARLARSTEKPVVAIGGLKAENAAEVLLRGASCAAVISDITRAKDVSERIDTWRRIQV